MLQNAYLLAKIGADTAENEQHFAKNLRKTENYPTGPERPPASPALEVPVADPTLGLDDLSELGPVEHTRRPPMFFITVF